MYKYNFKFSVFLIHESKMNNTAYYGYIRSGGKMAMMTCSLTNGKLNTPHVSKKYSFRYN